MFDYKLIEALAQVIETGGFERAAGRLYITQSAVSQRIRQLEDNCGQILLTRSTPPQPTAAGRLLLKHYRQVRLLEEGMATALLAEGQAGPTSLAIGINADSLASWFLEAIQPLLDSSRLFIDLRVADQEQTHNYLRLGEVVGCISTESKAMQGCRVAYLGQMNYRLLATPGFCRRWFPEGFTSAAAASAPAVIFNHQDRLHHYFMQQQLNLKPADFRAHYVPAPEPFLQMICAGNACGMVPDWQSRGLRTNGKLVELVPGVPYPVELYWHCWNLASPLLQEFSRQLERAAQGLLDRE